MARFVADWLIVIDGTFNTNELRLLLLECVGVLSTNQTFPGRLFVLPFGIEWIDQLCMAVLERGMLYPWCSTARVISGDLAAALTTCIPYFQCSFSDARLAFVVERSLRQA